MNELNRIVERQERTEEGISELDDGKIGSMQSEQQRK